MNVSVNYELGKLSLQLEEAKKQRDYYLKCLKDSLEYLEAGMPYHAHASISDGVTWSRHNTNQE